MSDDNSSLHGDPPANPEAEGHAEGAARSASNNSIGQSIDQGRVQAVSVNLSRDESRTDNGQNILQGLQARSTRVDLKDIP